MGRWRNPTRPPVQPELVLFNFLPPTVSGAPWGQDRADTLQGPCVAQRGPSLLGKAEVEVFKRYSEVQPQGGRGSSRGALRRPLPQPAFGGQGSFPEWAGVTVPSPQGSWEFSHREMPTKGVAGRGTAMWGRWRVRLGRQEPRPQGPLGTTS